MSWKDPQERHSDALVEAIHAASRHISSTIEQGFKHMADKQTAALGDLATAVQNIGDAIAGEIAALQAAVSAATDMQPDDSAAIEASVTKLNDLASVLKDSVAPAVPAPTPATPTPAAPTV